ncbi:hypothetical protein ACHAXA_009280 [Cyclostephanos tholiformis]|uniref:Uncharacterized protein n=1 Tax=Cyclostephanos tholiformis TaxID=382380 RepID=A0ABD3RE28_9STRA
MSLMDYVLFACTAGASILSKASASSTSGGESCSLKNSAFVFVKPHANTKATQNLVREKLLAKGIEILSESDINGKVIDEKKLIDQHYYAIASKATILPADEIPVPDDKFEEAFGEKWSDVLKESRAANAMQACERFGCNAEELDAAWQAAKVVKFGGGFYCGLVSVKDQSPLYVFNAFFMVMRSKFVGEDMSIHCYEVQWDPKKLSWASFRGELLGPTDPKDGPEGSIRKAILDNNWLGASAETDAFGKALIGSGLSKKTIADWSVDPRVTLPGGQKGSVFDALEDMDVDDCLAKLVEMNQLNA